MGIGPPFNLVPSEKIFFEPKIFLGDFSKKFFFDLNAHVGYQIDPLDLLEPIKRPKKNFELFSGILPKQKK